MLYNVSKVYLMSCESGVNYKQSICCNKELLYVNRVGILT